MAHFDNITKLSKGFEIPGKTDISITMKANEVEKIYVVQCHPEAKKNYKGNK